MSQTVAGRAQRPSATDETVATGTADTTSGKVFAPAANPGAAIVGTVLGMAFAALAVIAVRDLIVRAGWLGGEGWLAAAARWVADLRWWAWMWPAAIAAVIVGSMFLWLAVAPRKRTHLSLAGHQVMWTRRGDVARRCSAVVSELPGVEHATTVVGRRTVKVTVAARAEVGEPTAVRATVDDVVSILEKPLRSKVKIVDRHGGGVR
ncbi:DUF6286 domain-containing protein [Gordonia sp. CPCC 206044]|uniref:DUF6286 domain-containing protein n=1 Tax=Gordonia sp. CPCC 206044 TaxID=3140793 RepID=UPI003AF3D0F2